MIVLQGGSALSDYQQRKIVSSIQSINKTATLVECLYYHFVQTTEDLQEPQQHILNALFDYASSAQSGKISEQFILVVPRFGTISPWSSKATDIIHNCGLHEVSRAERGIAYFLDSEQPLTSKELSAIAPHFYDKLTESVLYSFEEAEKLFYSPQPSALIDVALTDDPLTCLQDANETLGLALSQDEIEYLADSYKQINRNPTDAELMMFAQANSEHCRHKIFNAQWVIDGKKQKKTLFEMIKNTYNKSSEKILSAYSDNAAVFKGNISSRMFIEPNENLYISNSEESPILLKVETHNHPTAISPYPGAATGSGGEIRDEAAVGSGSKPKAGLCGFSVSNLKIPDNLMPWEVNSVITPSRIASPLNIMIDGPIGAASFNNEFGRPNLLGYFRTFESNASEQSVANFSRGYHKPIMLAGGIGHARPMHITKNAIPDNTPIFVIGGPAMLIGLGGGAASSMGSGASTEDLDFASVQRGNAEIQRRCQEVIDRCTSLGDSNPILSIHDVGAGGLSNALPEIVHASNKGAIFDLRKIPSAETGLSPKELWCNEAQERFVLAVKLPNKDEFMSICQREKCPVAEIGYATKEETLSVTDSHFDNTPIDMPLEMLLGKTPKLKIKVGSELPQNKSLQLNDCNIVDAAKLVLQVPCVASKNFLITIGDRTVGGLSARDQMIGPWQVPTADVAVTATDYNSQSGEAMSIGERTPLSLINPEASARMAVAESIMNISAASINDIRDITLSANWMADSKNKQDNYALFKAVEAIGEDLCPSLGIAIPVGKDSLSMRTVWEDNDEENIVSAPMSLIITAASPVSNIENTLTPELNIDKETEIVFIDLASGKQRLGGSAFAQAFSQLGNECPDLESSKILKDFFMIIQELNAKKKIHAYHDRSDGGLFSCLCECAFTSHTGLNINIDDLGDNPLSILFNEELGGLIQINKKDKDSIFEIFGRKGIGVYSIATLSEEYTLKVLHKNNILIETGIEELHKLWGKMSYEIQKLRDNPDCADSEYNLLGKSDNPGLTSHLTFDINQNVKNISIKTNKKPKVAILREQGVNGHYEMAAAFNAAGFTPVDVHMTDLLNSSHSLGEYKGLAACGGFSYGDVLGAGGGWANTILFNDHVKDKLMKFFNRSDVFSLGVCNGCQMMSMLKDLIPGAEAWPRFVKNTSEQFEARLCLVEVQNSPSILFKDMEGSVIPIVVSHGEGKTYNGSASLVNKNDKLVTMRYVDNKNKITEDYPANPNGSPGGATAYTTKDGRFNIMMPHPERLFKAFQYSWHPANWKDVGAWLKIFHNARNWVA